MPRNIEPHLPGDGIPRKCSSGIRILPRSDILSWTEIPSTLTLRSTLGEAAADTSRSAPGVGSWESLCRESQVRPLPMNRLLWDLVKGGKPNRPKVYLTSWAYVRLPGFTNWLLSWKHRCAASQHDIWVRCRQMMIGTATDPILGYLFRQWTSLGRTVAVDSQTLVIWGKGYTVSQEPRLRSVAYCSFIAPWKPLTSASEGGRLQLNYMVLRRKDSDSDLSISPLNDGNF